MNESKPRRTYLLLPDRFVPSIIHKYRRRQRKRADSGHHTNITIDDIDDPRFYDYEQQERNNGHNNSSNQNNNSANTSSMICNNNELYNSNNNSNVQSNRRSSPTTSSSSSYDGENNDNNASLRSACSGMTPRTTPSLAAESGMSVRLQHYQVGTPVSYALNINNDNESLSSSSSSSLASSIPPFSSSPSPQQHPAFPNSPSTFSSFPHRSNSRINETDLNPQQQQQVREERRSSFFRRRRPRIREDSSNPSIANSWRIRRARASIEEDQPLPDFETQVFCATCEKWVQSRIRYRLGALTWLVAFTLFLCTIILFWVPFYVKYFKDVVHYCPACGTNIGRHTKL